MAGFVYAPDAVLDSSEIEAIESVSRSYWEAWYTGDADRMRGCVHPDWDNWGLVRRIIDTRTEYIDTELITRSQFLELVGRGVGYSDPNDRFVEVEVLVATHHLASVRTVGNGMIDLLHLIRFPEGWRIVHTIWSLEGGVIANATTDI